MPTRSRDAIWAIVASILMLLEVTGCRGRARVNENRGAGPGTDIAPAAAPPSGLARDRGRGEGAGADTPGELITIRELEGEPEPEPELDLGLRVKNAYGYPAECLGPEAIPEGVTQFSIRLSVTLTSTGTVTRASVSAPVSADARTCLQRRADRLRVAGPIPDAPRTVSTSIDVQAVARVATAGAPEAPPDYELPPGARSPGSVLPAVVGDGPAEGYRPPGRTLPAVVGDGPAPGARPAGVALPARGSMGRDWMWISGSAEARGEVPDDLDDDDD